MGLLTEIQSSLVKEGSEISPILFKLRLLASRLSSVTLEEWVRHELEGYPEGAVLPRYRTIPLALFGTFSGPFGSGIKNAPLPTYLVEQHAGKRWTQYHIRQSISAVDKLAQQADKGGGTLQLDCANLILLLQGKIYEDYACNSVVGIVSAAALAEIQNAVRGKIMELTIQIEKSFPEISDISAANKGFAMNEKEGSKVSHITNTIVNGNMTTINNSGSQTGVAISTMATNNGKMVNDLIDRGISEHDAKDFMRLLSQEKGKSREEPFGEKASKWFAENIKKALDGTWSAGVGAATEILKDVALKYYGLS